MEKYVIIVAAGKGVRMENSTPKQFLPLAGRPLLMHTIKKFYEYEKTIQIIIVLAAENILLWQQLCRDHNFTIPHKIVEGGSERLFSVKNALQFVPENTLVAVHDGVRPFVSLLVIANTFTHAEEHQSSIPVVPVVETIRQIDETGAKTLDREYLRVVQTPQCFQSNILKKAYSLVLTNDAFTDDAGLVEYKLGISPFLTEGNPENIKITHAKDFLFAEGILKDC